MTDLLQLFLGLPLFLLPWGFHSRAAFGISPSSFLSVWPICLSFLFLISKCISSWPVTLHKSLLEMTFDHHNLKMYRRHLLTQVCVLCRIPLVTSRVSHPYKSTDFTQALKILILVFFIALLVKVSFLYIVVGSMGMGVKLDASTTIDSKWQYTYSTLLYCLVFTVGHWPGDMNCVRLINKEGMRNPLFMNQIILWTKWSDVFPCFSLSCKANARV